MHRLLWACQIRNITVLWLRAVMFKWDGQGSTPGSNIYPLGDLGNFRSLSKSFYTQENRCSSMDVMDFLTIKQDTARKEPVTYCCTANVSYYY